MEQSLVTLSRDADFGDLLQAIFTRCKDMKAKQAVMKVVEPYSRLLLARFPDKPLKQFMTYGKMHLSNGTECYAYVLTLTRADGKVTRWALFIDDMEWITGIDELPDDLPVKTMLKQ